MGRISFDLGPTLARWLAMEDPRTHAAIVDQGRGGGAIAQGYHHSILPLASAEDRRTEIRWGLRDFELRFGSAARGLWLPETAVDLPTLRDLADEGVEYTIVAPWQLDDPGIDTRRPYRVELGEGRSIVVVAYDGPLSASVSFEPGATSDADRFARERVATRLAGTPFSDGTAPLAVIATDGELYGHHQQFRDLFLQRLLVPDPRGVDRGFDVVDLAQAVREAATGPLPTVPIRERTSWSCHHGVLRWWAECPDAVDGRWKGPLRAALERLAAGIDAVTDGVLAVHPARPDRIAGRDAYIDVVIGAEDEEAFASRHLGGTRDPAATARFVALMEAQRWRLAMFASDGWFWDDPVRTETHQVLRCAARAARLVDEIGGSNLEDRLVADLGLLRSPSTGLDGASIYRSALVEVGQPATA